MPRATLTPEAKLLFLVSAVAPSDSALRALLSDGIDWDELCALSQHETACSILLKSLSRVGVDSGSPGYQQLRQAAMISTMQMLKLEQLLHKAVTHLARAHIDTILLKGAGLAYTAYASFAGRPMGDLDLLVRARDAERAWLLLRSHGWRTEDETVESERLVGHHHFPRLFQDEGAQRLEIHDDLLAVEHPFRFSTDLFWERASRVSSNGKVFLAPHPMHQLWHACVHFTWSHAMEWGSWRTVRDVAAILHGGQIDWTDFVTFARETRAATCCFWALRLARRLSGADVPDGVLEMLRPPRAEFVLRRLENHLLTSLLPSDKRCPSVRLSRRLWELAIAPGWSGHGESRPWHGSERWVADRHAAGSERPAGSSFTGRVRKFGAGAAYIIRLSRVSVPVDLNEPRTAMTPE